MRIRDRRATQKDISKDRRMEQRRKDAPTKHGAPIRRDDDWDKIDIELKD